MNSIVLRATRRSSIAPWPALGLLALLAACGSPQAPPIVGTLERHRIEVAAPANEQIVALTVREGDRVQPGQLLAELDSGTQSAQREALAAHLERLPDDDAAVVRRAMDLLRVHLTPTASVEKKA